MGAALAAKLGSELQRVWVPNATRIIEIEDSDIPLRRLSRNLCDLVGSVPGEEALGEGKRRYTLSPPYYGVAFELVGDPSLPRELKALGDTTTAVQLQTFAHLLLEHLGVPWRSATTTRGALTFLDEGSAGAALVWGPDLAPLGRVPLDGFEAPQALRWNAHFAMRRGEPRAHAISEALGELIASGEIAEILRRHGVPEHPPFESVSSIAARRAARGK